MTAAVETMAYANEVPWHGLGFKVGGDLTPKQMLKAAKVDWTVEKRKIALYGPDGEQVVGSIPGSFALTRATDNKVFSLVGSTYKPVQNEVAFDFFKKFTEAGHMTMETAGALHGGKYVWALAKIGKNFTLGKNDKVEGYLLLSSPHVIGRSMVLKLTPIRVVCWNTLTWALGADMHKKSASAGSFRMPHSVEFSDRVKDQAEIALGLAKDQMTEFKEATQLLVDTKVKPEQAEAYFCDVLKFDPKKAAKKKDGDAKEPRMLEKFRQALIRAPGQQLVTAQNTLWGAYNAVSYVVDHDLGRDRSAALYTAWYGQKASLKRAAFQKALDIAK